MLYCTQGEFEKAIQSTQEGLARDPNNVVLLDRLMLAYMYADPSKHMREIEEIGEKLLGLTEDAQIIAHVELARVVAGIGRHGN
jgi:hypothetical protein